MTIIQSLWIGNKLSPLERLSISSHLKQGHEFHLYTFGPIQNVPKGTIVKSGEEILPANQIEHYAQDGGHKHCNWTAFSNCFRYKLLFERGGWWSDMDVICLRPFTFTNEYVIASEIIGQHTSVATCCIKTPQRSELMLHCYNECRKHIGKSVAWGTLGPVLLRAATQLLSLQSYVVPHYVFCPLAYTEFDVLLRVSSNLDVRQSYAIHAYNEMWRRNNIDKFGAFPATCLFKRLERSVIPLL